MDLTEQPDVFSGKDVEEAIAAGLAALSLSREQVEVEVLDKGARGVFGIGGRSATVRLVTGSSPTYQAEAVSHTAPAIVPESTPVVAPDVPSSISAQVAEETARTVLAELLEKMGFDAEIKVSQAEPDPDEDYAPMVLDVYGSEAGALIGRRGETLAALQRIVRLIVGNRLTGRVNLIVDVEGYKREREQKLRRLADRLAGQAAESGRTVPLEPMSAYERRIIHITLRDRPDVRTESVGEGYRRRVTIIPLVAK